MITYKLQNLPNGKLSSCVIRSDGATIPFDPDNVDYQEYLKWLAEGNVPLAAETNTPTPADGE